MNFKKLMIIVVAVVLMITVYKFFTRVDRGDASAVATAFTKAMKNKDTATASGFYAPDQAAAWRAAIDEKVSGMRSGARDRFYERFPSKPDFGAVASVAGKQSITSADEQFSLEMSQVEGQWYVAHFE